jgi:hypothetical protein
VAQFPFAKPADILVVEKDPAACRLDQPQNQPGQGGFPASGLPDDAEDFTPADIEGNVVNSLDETKGPMEKAGCHRKVFGQMVDLN